ncbi:MAG TPA: hypothetical protein VF597_01190 [Candidatus Saccharimonadales bacterium]|jgi:hypothetical protein
MDRTEGTVSSVSSTRRGKMVFVRASEEADGSSDLFCIQVTSGFYYPGKKVKLAIDGRQAVIIR